METCLSCHKPIITRLAQPFSLSSLLSAGIKSVQQNSLRKIQLHKLMKNKPYHHSYHDPKHCNRLEDLNCSFDFLNFVELWFHALKLHVNLIINNTSDWFFFFNFFFYNSTSDWLWQRTKQLSWMFSNPDPMVASFIILKEAAKEHSFITFTFLQIVSR